MKIRKTNVAVKDPNMECREIDLEMEKLKATKKDIETQLEALNKRKYSLLLQTSLGIDFGDDAYLDCKIGKNVIKTKGRVEFRNDTMFPVVFYPYKKDGTLSGRNFNVYDIKELSRE